MRKKVLSNEELAVFSRQLSLIISSDVSILEGLDLILEQVTNKSLELLLKRIKQSIQNGKTLGGALIEEKSQLPEFYINMIIIGEDSGNLHKVLLRIAESYEKDIKTAKKVRSAITYPVVLSFLMLGVIVLLVTTVMPMFGDILNSLGGEIPAFSMALIEVSTFIGENIFMVLGFLVVILLGIDLYKNTTTGKKFFDKLKLGMPIQKNIITSLAALRFARNMAMLLRSGISISKAMVMIRPLMDNETISKSIDQAIIKLNNGETLRTALQGINLFPSLLVKLLSVAESTGHTEEMFDRAADTMENELDDRLERLTTILEPMLIILLSLILGAILFSVIFPVIGIMNSIG